jgi:hypothetical protein
VSCLAYECEICLIKKSLFAKERITSSLTAEKNKKEEEEEEEAEKSR